MRFQLTQGRFVVKLYDESHKHRQELPAVLTDLREYDEVGTAIYFQVFRMLSRFRSIGENIERIRVRDILDLCVAMSWLDDTEFVDDLLFIIPILDDVYVPFENKRLAELRKHKTKSMRSDVSGKDQRTT